MLSFPILFLKVAKVWDLRWFLVFLLSLDQGLLSRVQLEVSACVIETNRLETLISGTSPFLAL